jgi:hypothetical protein
MVCLLIITWFRYQKLTDGDKKSSSNAYSIVFFALSLVLWEYNLFDNDYRFEVFTTIIADALLLVGTVFFNHGVLMKGSTSKYSAIKIVPIISIVCICISNLLINYSNGKLLIGYSLCLLFTLVTFLIVSIKLFFYYKNMKMVEIGIFSIVSFMGLFTTMLLSVAYYDDMHYFDLIKVFLLFFTFSVYFILSNLAYSFLQEIVNHKFVQVFTSYGENKEEKPFDPHSLNDINDLISDDKIEELVEKLLTSSRYDKERMTSLLLIANRLSSINTEKVRETVTEEEYHVERHRIVDSLISLVNEK